MYAHTLAQNEAAFLTSIVNAVPEGEKRTQQVSLLLETLFTLPPQHIEGMLLAFANFGLSGEQRFQAISNAFERLDGVTNQWSLDGTLEAARRLTFEDPNLAEYFNNRSNRYMGETTPERARIVQTVAEGRAHATRWYPKAA